MQKMVSRSALVLLVGVAAGCGGASQQRVDALEAQVHQLQAPGAPAGGPTAAELQKKIDAFEASTNASIETTRQSIEALEGELSALSGKPASKAGAGGAPWGAVAEIMGVETDSVKVDGDSYAIDRDWLVRQIQALSITGKGPRLIAGKRGGVTIRGIRPKSLADRLGLKNADEILAVGEQEVGTPAELYTQLKAATGSVTVKIKRRKKELALQYTLTD